MSGQIIHVFDKGHRGSAQDPDGKDQPSDRVRQGMDEFGKQDADRGSCRGERIHQVVFRCCVKRPVGYAACNVPDDDEHHTFDRGGCGKDQHRHARFDGCCSAFKFGNGFGKCHQSCPGHGTADAQSYNGFETFMPVRMRHIRRFDGNQKSDDQCQRIKYIGNRVQRICMQRGTSGLSGSDPLSCGKHKVPDEGDCQRLMHLFCCCFVLIRIFKPFHKDI